MFPLLAGQLWRPVALALLVAAALGYRALLVHQRDAARAEASHLSASLADAEASNTALQSAIASQNSAVAQLRAELEQGVRDATARERGDGEGRDGDARGRERRASAPGRADRRRLRGGDPMGQRAGGGAQPMVMREAQDLDNAARSASKSRSTERPSVPLRGQPSAGIEGAPRVLVKKALPRSFMRASIDTQIASRRSFTSAAFVQDDNKRGFPSVILRVSEGSTRSDRSFSPHLSIRSFTEGADSRRASGEQYDGRSEKGTTCIAPLASALTSIIHAEEKKLFTPIPAAGRGRGLGRAHWLAALACAVAIAGCAANAPAAPTVRPLMVQVPVLHETACPAPALANPVLPIAALKPGSPPADTMRAYAAAVAILKGAVRERDAVLAGCVQTGDATREQAENIR